MPPFQTIRVYEGGEKVGVTFIALAGLTSLLSIIYLIIFKRPNPTTFKNTNMLGYLISLLIANLLQSVGSVMNLEWVAKGGVQIGDACSAQGGLKHAGNLGASIWTVVIAIHLFGLLFLRIRADTALFLALICLAWTLIVVLVWIGPIAIEKTDSGPYYGISGVWCWITTNYPKEQIFLEYFFAFLSASICFVLYVVVLLRLRGILVKNGDNKWRIRVTRPRGVDTLVDTGRNRIDSATLNISKRMVWYPVAYTILVLPIMLIRLSDFDGQKVPFWAMALGSVIFNLMGFVNVMLIIHLERWFPAVSALPTTSTRQELPPTSFSNSEGLAPLTLRHLDDQEKGDINNIGKKDSRTRKKDSTLWVRVELPVRPQNSYIPPEEWQSTGKFGMLY
ncbi:hypothetical protein NLJ89_g9243 [Agrocybe chaxingu]|uniref:G-protein coupled receptors family 2 profile 2 domain-containing protein n=1 Tax=Agrocybe chaxingu TaxID=84603 RepID=A0A9W8JTQ7_9AGAR|nr:hypothetical protein NLJ89_g9243 [Agrocybe chaxingu]